MAVGKVKRHLDKCAEMSTKHHAGPLQTAPGRAAASRNPAEESDSGQRGSVSAGGAWENYLNKEKWGLTSGGKIFSAARRGTENPPWVLVSLAVSVLQKNSDGCLFCFRARSDARNASRSHWMEESDSPG